MRHLGFFLIIFISHLSTHAQHRIDSLLEVVENLSDDTSKVHTYIYIYYEYHRANIDSALFYAKKAENLSRILNFRSGLAISLYRQSTIYRSLSEFDKSEELLAQATGLFEELRDTTNLLYAKIDYGRLTQLQNKNDQAITLFQQAIQLAKQNGDKNAEARVENYLGQIFNGQKQLDRALQHFEKALGLVREIAFKPGISAMLTNIADIYSNQKEYDKAFEYLNEALVLKREMRDQLGLSRVLLNIAGVHFEMLEYEKAQPFYEEAYEIASGLNQVQQQALTTYGLAHNLYVRGEYEKALEYSQEALPYIQEAKDLSLAVSNSELTGHIYAKLGLYEKSYESLAWHSMLTDSLYDKTKIALINELEEKYENEQKAKEINLLESENRLQSLQIEKREGERNYLLAFAIAALILIGLGYNQYRIKQRSNEKLKELDRMKTSFFENLSHEFRTPLSLIMAPIKERMQRADAKDKQELGLIYKSAERLLTMINELLDLAKLEAGGYQINKSSVNVNQFFKVLEASYSSFAASKSIVFNVSIPNESVWLIIDQKGLSQICNNLLSNAFKFTPEGGEVTMAITYKSNLLQVSVSDSGPGIKAEDQERIFNRFEQVSHVSYQGTGIGLALVKELAEAQGGKIEVETELEKGSTFTLLIPAQVGDPVETNEEVRSELPLDEYAISNSEQPADQQIKVLVVEDNPELRDYLSRLLGRSYQILKAVDGRDGLKQATEHVPDLIISDVMMPEMDGLEFCHKLQEQVATDHIPVVLLTARADGETKLSGLKEGAIQYVTKPFEPEELKITIENIIRQQSKLREKYQVGENLSEDSKKHPFISSCEKVVDEHLDDSTFEMTQFAKEVGMSRMQLHRKLISLTNMSSTAFIRHHRLAKAKVLLEAGEHVSQVAYAVGFSSLSYFSTSFKKQFGKSPSGYSHTS